MERFFPAVRAHGTNRRANATAAGTKKPWPMSHGVLAFGFLRG